MQVPAADVAFALERRIESLTTRRPNATPSTAPPAAPPSPRRTR
ncbi:hypothetical protein [Streptomyces sp. NBC_01439]|nr:hypothetical protein [Streptomyces sp. NBC_01439]